MTDTQLVHFDAARRELTLATSVDEVKQLRDKAEAMRQYLRQQGQSLEMQNQCAELKLRAERRIGEMLVDMPKNEGQLLRGNTMLPREDTPTYADLGISKMQSHRWQLEASLPEETFEQHIAEVKASGEELTSPGSSITVGGCPGRNVAMVITRPCFGPSISGTYRQPL